MEDTQIIDLFWARSEQAITETESKYGSMCMRIATAMLHNTHDAQECVNDTYMALWNAIPPARPGLLSAYIAKITRKLAMRAITYSNAKKRSAMASVSIHELEECIPAPGAVETQLEGQALSQCIEQWLRELGCEDRNIFLRRYWFFDEMVDIGVRFELSEGAVKTRLCRLRKKLKIYLTKEGFNI